MTTHTSLDTHAAVNAWMREQGYTWFPLSLDNDFDGIWHHVEGKNMTHDDAVELYQESQKRWWRFWL